MRVLIAFCLAAILAQVYGIDWRRVSSPPINLPELEHLIENDNFISFIVGGQEAGFKRFPYQVGYFKGTDSDRSFCGGSLLDDEWVLTAAHCVLIPGNITIILGAHNISAAEPEQLTIVTNQVIVHENFNYTSAKNDIALIRLPRKVKFTERIQPVRLPKLSQVFLSFVGRKGIISGWGLNSDSATDITDTLQWEQNTIISNTKCKSYYGSDITSSNICMSTSGGKSMCNGDSGGPLVITDTDGAPTQVGIASYSSDFGCETGSPDTFTRVTSYLPWIVENTGILIEP